MAGKPSRLTLALLGPPLVTVGGKPLNVDTKKAVALLAYLAVGESWPSRDQLVDLLWSESDPERGRSALRRTLSALRAGLGEGRLGADRDRVWVERHDSELDTEEVDRLLDEDHGHGAEVVCTACIKPLQRAAGLHRGEFMSGFRVKEARGWEEWVRQAETGRRRIRQVVYDRLTRAFAAAGDYRAAARTAEERLAGDPLDEAGYRHLMLALALSGDRNAALLAYRRCVQVLEKELGVTPLEETAELSDAILEGDLPRFPGVRRSPVVATPRPVSRTLVGRGAEMELLEGLLEEASTQGRVVLVSGPEGIGKTRLLEELIDGAYHRGRMVVSGRGYESEREVPYGVIAQIIEATLGGPGADEWMGEVPAWAMAEVARLVPALGSPPTTELEPGPAERRLVEGLARYLGSLPPGSVITVDDLHSIDQASDRALSYSARQFARRGGLLALSGRTEALEPASSLRAWLRSSPEHLLSIELAPLPASAAAALARNRGHDQLTPSELMRRTGGIPLYVVGEIDGPGEEAVRASVSRRLDQLSQLGMQAVTTVSVADRPVGVDWLVTVSGRSEEEVVTGLEEVLRVGLVRELEDGRVDLSHDLVRRTVASRTTLARRRLLHRRAAAMLGRDPASAARAVRHFREAGLDREAGEAAFRAGQHALTLFALHEAKDHFEMALALGHAEQVHMALGDVALVQGRFVEARSHFEAAAAGASGADLALAEHRLGGVARRLGHFEAAGVHFQRAQPGHPQPTHLLADQALLEQRLGRPDAARALAMTAREKASSDADIARALGLIGILTAEPGEASAILEESLRLAGNDPVLRAAALNSLSFAHQRAGALASALTAAEEGLELVRSVGDRHREAALLNRIADVLHALGQVEESKAALRQAVAVFADLQTDDIPTPELWLLTEW